MIFWAVTRTHDLLGSSRLGTGAFAVVPAARGFRVSRTVKVVARQRPESRSASGSYRRARARRRTRRSSWPRRVGRTADGGARNVSDPLRLVLREKLAEPRTRPATRPGRFWHPTPRRGRSAPRAPRGAGPRIRSNTQVCTDPRTGITSPLDPAAAKRGSMARGSEWRRSAGECPWSSWLSGRCCSPPSRSRAGGSGAADCPTMTLSPAVGRACRAGQVGSRVRARNDSAERRERQLLVVTRQRPRSRRASRPAPRSAPGWLRRARRERCRAPRLRPGSTSFQLAATDWPEYPGALQGACQASRAIHARRSRLGSQHLHGGLARPGDPGAAGRLSRPGVQRRAHGRDGRRDQGRDPCEDHLRQRGLAAVRARAAWGRCGVAGAPRHLQGREPHGRERQRRLRGRVRHGDRGHSAGETISNEAEGLIPCLRP